jgi:hypothetical protein
MKKDTLLFLKTLAQNNNKAWFDENRPHYEKVKKELRKSFDQAIMNVDFESEQTIDSFESFDVKIYQEDLQYLEVISLDRGDQASTVTAQDDLIFDELADNDFDANFDNNSDVSDFI